LALGQHSSVGAKVRIAPPPPSPLLLCLPLSPLSPLPLFRSVLCWSRCVRRFFCRILVPGELASGELASLGEALVCIGAACDVRACGRCGRLDRLDRLGRVVLCGVGSWAGWVGWCGAG